jgi:hypothetical protein
MKKAVIAVVSLVVVLGVLLAVPAFSSPSTPTTQNKVSPQVRALQGQVRALKSRVTKLERSVAGIQSCESTVQALSRFPGYVWTDGVNTYSTTAVDAPDPGEPTHIYVSVVDARCVTSSSSSYSLAKPTTAQGRSTRGRARLNHLLAPQSTRPVRRAQARLSQLQRKR